MFTAYLDFLHGSCVGVTDMVRDIWNLNLTGVIYSPQPELNAQAQVKLSKVQLGLIW